MNTCPLLDLIVPLLARILDPVPEWVLGYYLSASVEVKLYEMDKIAKHALSRAK
jgi:hypothetical protein